MSEVVPASNSVLASFIERAARDPEFDVQKFGELLRMQREVEHDQARKTFNRAMASAQAEMLPIVRDAKNSHLNNKYAKLETIDAAIRPIYTNWGFSVRYGSAPAPSEGWMRITCTVAHDSGYFEENYLDAPVTTTGSQGGRMAITPVQAIGSTVTYLRRYLLGMVWNTVLADDDDDGESQRPQWERPRNVAAATPRADRKVDPTPYEAGPPAPDRKSWAQWAQSLELADRDSKDTAAIGRIIAKSEIAEIVRLAQEGEPSPAKTRIVAAFRNLEARYLADPPQPPDADDLDEVVIAGEHNLAAG